MRIAFSVASAPPLVKNTLSMLSGATSMMRRAASDRSALAWNGAMVHSRPAASWIAAISLGCWWPRLTFISWLLKSRYLLSS